jgi:hypothetical protein
MATRKAEVKEVINVTAPDFRLIPLTLVGTAPLVQSRFTAKAMQAMKASMEAGQTSKKGKERKARDFEDDFQNAMHKSTDGWVGVPAAAIRNACIDVCRMVGFKMTHAKMSIFVKADGNDAVDGIPLIRLDAGEPERLEMATRIQQTTNITIRPIWRKWRLHVVLRFDAGQFTASDVVNLIARAGVQVGIGEGRPYSRMSNGLGYGTFEIETQK